MNVGRVRLLRKIVKVSLKNVLFFFPPFEVQKCLSFVDHQPVGWSLKGKTQGESYREKRNLVYLIYEIWRLETEYDASC